jgi:amino acid transporter
VTAGALYHFVPQGLGRWSGFVVAVTLMGLVVIAGPFFAIGFGQAFTGFLSAVGVYHAGAGGTFVFELLVIVVTSALAYFDIRLSTTVLLAIELSSMALIFVLLLIILGHSHQVIDHRQLHLTGATVHGTVLGIVFLVLAFGGFEGSASLGFESKRPSRAIPLVIIGAIAVAGLFYIFNAYVQVAGFQNLKLDLATQTAPVSVLAQQDGVAWMGKLALLGLSFSWFAAFVAWMVYGTRVLFTTARDGVAPRIFGTTNRKFRTPHVAVATFLAIWLVLTIYVYAANANITTVFTDMGAFEGYCLTLLYLLAAASTVVWAYRHKVLTWKIVVAGVIGAGVMGMVFYYSFVPAPLYPLSYWLYGFGIMVASSVVLYVILHLTVPARVAGIGRTAELVAEDFAGSTPSPEAAGT